MMVLLICLCAATTVAEERMLNGEIPICVTKQAWLQLATFAADNNFDGFSWLLETKKCILPKAGIKCSLVDVNLLQNWVSYMCNVEGDFVQIWTNHHAFEKPSK